MYCNKEKNNGCLIAGKCSGQKDFRMTRYCDKLWFSHLRYIPADQVKQIILGCEMIEK